MGMREMPDVTELKSDIKTYVESSIPPVYDPIRQWFDTLPQWDGKDRITDFLNRIPGMSDEQLVFMKTWMRSVTAHWLGIDEEHGNETVPLLIGNQGCGKSTFCLRFLPTSLRQYYLDHFNLTNKFDKEMALSGSLLICLDEMDQYKAGQMAELKQALSKVKVNGRRIYGKTIDERKRYASFIATTNNRHPLKDMTGSRRYLTIEIPDGKLIDNQQEINYEQIYAQLLHEVRDEKMRYWFTNEETLRIQELNIPYQESVDLEAMIDSFYRKPEPGERGNSLTSLDIRKELQSKFPEIAMRNLSSEKIGRALKELKVKKTRSSRGVAYSLVKRAA
jgi:predicted P-loop ATPase